MIVRINKQINPQVFNYGVIHYVQAAGSRLDITNEFAQELRNKGYVGYTYKPIKTKGKKKTK